MNYDKTKYRAWKWYHPVMLHWMVNPGLVINELMLGQRVPKLTLIEKNPAKSLPEKTVIPCPHCGTMHSGLKWSARNNAFKNWFGLYCDQCGETIPCLWNITSLVILALTFPLWIGFKNSWKSSWLQKQPMRYENLNLENAVNSLEGYGWVKMGISWGFFMYIIMTFVFPWLSGDAIVLKKALIAIPIWATGGLAFGYTMKLVNGKNGRDRKGV